MTKYIIFSILLLTQIFIILGNDVNSCMSEIQKINNQIDNIKQNRIHDSIMSLQTMLMNHMIESRFSIQNLTQLMDKRFESFENRFNHLENKFETSELRDEVRFNHLEHKFDNLSLEFKGISFWQTYFTTPTWLLLAMAFPTVVKYIVDTRIFKATILKFFYNIPQDVQNEEKKED